jgi:hypothetical protein
VLEFIYGVSHGYAVLDPSWEKAKGMVKNPLKGTIPILDVDKGR